MEIFHLSLSFFVRWMRLEYGLSGDDHLAGRSKHSGDSRGGLGVSNESPLEPKLCHFHGEFQEKLVKLHKSNLPRLI